MLVGAHDHQAGVRIARIGQERAGNALRQRKFFVAGLNAVAVEVFYHLGDRAGKGGTLDRQDRDPAVILQKQQCSLHARKE